ncbi:MAG: FKBP-type peptidyl-prolyl cis-trans isomerase [Treponema sp.]|nr:FKBP-type peptidyl-prolyl cis-trans isomerase [Treponema sp.]
MKYKLMFVLTVIAVAGLMSCNNSSGSSKKEVNFDKDASYALGLNIGAGLKDGLEADGIHPNIDEFIKGMRDGLSGRNPRFDLIQARDVLDLALDTLMETRDAEARQKEIEFLAENARKPGIIITPSGLQYEVISQGNGPRPTEDDVVVVHYDGKFIDGKFFDSSHTRGHPSEFKLGWIIQGWAEGLQLMNVGSKFTFYIPSELGYSAEGVQGVIPPYSTLIFDVELLEVKPDTDFDFGF